MENTKKREIADAVLQVTGEYMVLYFQQNKGGTLDKQLLAALHCGFSAGMIFSGCEEKDMMEALTLVQKDLIEFEKEHKDK